MGYMNAIQQIEAAVRAEFPQATLKVDPPKNIETGFWFLDITDGAKTVIVECRPGKGFGASFAGAEGTDLEIGYGEGPQQFHEDQDIAMQAIRKLLNG
jgi:hypothetical protein